MTDFPGWDTPGGFDDPDIEEADQMINLKKIVQAAKEIPGATPWQNLDIAGDAITPAAECVQYTVGAQANGAVDDLTSIVATNMRDGSRLILKAQSGAEVITVKHLSGGGNIDLAGYIELILNDRDEIEFIYSAATGQWRLVRVFPIWAKPQTKTASFTPYPWTPYNVNSTGGAVVVAPPTASTCLGGEFDIAWTSGGNSVTLDPAQAGEKIWNKDTIVIQAIGDKIRFRSNNVSPNHFS